ncbi:hemolysin III family protein [Streptosporangium sp. NPDC051022]|uniref:PAQR family membrane homeostasis protein TrhA n=1 Tax=Streptosporangium sp. NPDC051022 TaxID=3155752 RepID=UPI00343ED490
MATTAAEGFALPGPPRPRLRGWLHAGALPVALIAGFVLVALGPTLQARLAAVVYAVTSGLLFGVSATYHRGALSPRLAGVLRRLDHANIYLIIAGTYTPFALLALDGPARVAVLAVVWTGAVAGVLFRVLWITAPRWLSTALYIALGWTAVFVLPQLVAGAGVAALLMVFAGGLLYTAGGVVYGLRRPDPSPRWFGFHEVFHALTVAAYLVQYVGVSLVVYAAA